jgi:Stress responsive A/B Barrel Domain
MVHRNNSLTERAVFTAMAICGSMFLSACSNLPVPSQPLRHVVLLWLKHPKRAADRAQLIRAAHSLRMLPGVLRVEVGHAVPPLPPGVDRSFDFGVVITFRDRAALERYEEDPRHHDAVGHYLEPLVRRYVVFNLSSR